MRLKKLNKAENEIVFFLSKMQFNAASKIAVGGQHVVMTLNTEYDAIIIVTSKESASTLLGLYHYDATNGVGSVLLVNVHNFAGNSQARIADRQNYLNLLAQYIVSEDPDYFIVCGDFNAKVPDSDYPILLAFCNAVGAKPVNGGVLGWFTTCSAEEIEKGYDNIIVSNNIEIKSIECDPILVAIGALHTDHLPVTATLEFH